jgi:hypothetical protein
MPLRSSKVAFGKGCAGNSPNRTISRTFRAESREEEEVEEGKEEDVIYIYMYIYIYAEHTELPGRTFPEPNQPTDIYPVFFPGVALGANRYPK